MTPKGWAALPAVIAVALERERPLALRTDRREMLIGLLRRHGNRRREGWAAGPRSLALGHHPLG
jgi:hypothetical protein